MRPKKTHEEYEAELFDRQIEIWPIERYDMAATPILHECLKGHQWLVAPRKILEGNGCPKCSGVSKLTTSEYADRLKERNIPFEVVGIYVSADRKISHKCPEGHVFSATPTNIYSGGGCSECKKINAPGAYNRTRFANDLDLANSPGILYVVVLVNKVTFERACVKIGITKGTSSKDVIRRASGFTGYDLRIQKVVSGTLKEAFELEQSLHKQWSQSRYLDSHRFGGHTELFQIEKLPEILKSIPNKG